MSSLQISQGTFRLSDTKTLKIDHLSVAAGESWAFVGSNGSGKSALARALAGDLTLLSGQRESHFSRVTRLSFEQLQKLVSDEWQRNNTDLLSPGEEDTGRTTAEIIQDEVKDPARCARLAEQFGISALLDRRFKYLSTGETRKTLLCQALMTDPQLLILDEPFDVSTSTPASSWLPCWPTCTAPASPWCWCSTASMRSRSLCNSPACWLTAPLARPARSLPCCSRRWSPAGTQ